jgi:low affinity Fe/Cu permease
MNNHTSPCETSEGKKSFGCQVRDTFRKFAQITSEVTGSAWAFMTALMLIVVWACSYPLFVHGASGTPEHESGFNTWQLVINTLTTIITFMMVFLIQNTQNRDAKVIHLKLDELIRALKGARNEMVDLEKLSDDDLKKLEQQFARIREKVPKGSTKVVKVEELVEVVEETVNEVKAGARRK